MKNKVQKRKVVKKKRQPLEKKESNSKSYKTQRQKEIDEAMENVSRLEKLAEKTAIEVGKGKKKIDEYMSVVTDLTTAKHHLAFLKQSKKNVGFDEYYINIK